MAEREPSPEPGAADEAAWLHEYRTTGSPEALTRVVRRYGGMVHSTCRRILRDEHAADDAAQAAFVVLMRRAPAVRSDADLSRWLYATARHAALVTRRSQRRRARHERAAGAQLPASVDADDDDADEAARVRARLDEAIAALPAAQRDAIVLRYFRGLSLADAARETGCPLRTFQTRMQRGLESLRRQLGRRGARATPAVLGAVLAEPSAAPAATVAAIEQACHAGAELTPAVAGIAGAVGASSVPLGVGIGIGIGALVLALAVAVPVLHRSDAPSVPAQAAPAAPVAAVAATAPVPQLLERALLAGHRVDGVRCVAFAPDGTRLASAGSDGTVRIWDVAAARQLQVLECGSVQTAVAFAPDGSRVAMAGFDGRLRVHELARGTAAPVVLGSGHTDQVWGLAFAPEGDVLASAGDDRIVRTWDLATGAARSASEPGPEVLRAVAFARDGTLVVAAGNDRALTIRDAAHGRVIASTRLGSSAWSLAVSPDGDEIAIAGSSPEPVIVAADTGARRRALRGHTADAIAVAWSRSGLLASGGQDGTVRIWRSATGEELARLAHPHDVSALAWSPDGATLAIGSWGRPAVALWRAAP